MIIFTPKEGDERPYLERLEEAVETLLDQGLQGISQFVFRDHERKRKVWKMNEDSGKFEPTDEWETYVVKQNATVKSMCEFQAKLHGTTTEKIAEEYYHMFTTPGKKIVGECPKCMAFLTEEESANHVCKEDPCEGCGCGC